MALASEETFGPVVPLFRFRTEDEVVRQANDTPYGLAAYFYSRNVARIWRVAERLETGIVAINEGAFASEAAPFGGVKESGYGREGSRYGLDEFLATKYLCQGGLAREATFLSCAFAASASVDEVFQPIIRPDERQEPWLA
jgi:succinate-semialdehyde dehydrogenase/glutarate-semialdehyde dehydrogenase